MEGKHPGEARQPARRREPAPPPAEPAQPRAARRRAPRPGRKGRPHPGAPMNQWAAQEFEMRSQQRVPAGIDGEAVQLDPPLRFHTRPGALRVRIAPAHPGVSPSAIEPERSWHLVRGLAEVAIHGAPRAQRELDASPAPGSAVG